MPAAEQGDMRLFVMNGRPLRVKGKYAAFRRVRSGGDMRSNIHAGGIKAAAEIDHTALHIAEIVRPKLVQDGMFLVGLDIVGDKLMEINVFSPGGLGSAQQFEKDQLFHPCDRSDRTKGAIHAVLRPQLRQCRHVHFVSAKPMTKLIDVGGPYFKKRHPKIGARPGTLVIADDAVAPKIRMISYDLDAVDEREIDDIERSGRAFEPANITWVDVQGFGDEELIRESAKSFRSIPWRWKTSSTCRSVPKAESTTTKSWSSLEWSGSPKTNAVDMEQVSILMGKNYVLTFQERYGDVSTRFASGFATGKAARSAAADRDYLCLRAVRHDHRWLLSRDRNYRRPPGAAWKTIVMDDTQQLAPCRS